MHVGKANRLVRLLADEDIREAIRLLEAERTQGCANRDDIFVLIYLYCLSGDVPKGEELAAAIKASMLKDAYADWVWAQLHAEFGFRPPGAPL